MTYKIKDWHKFQHFKDRKPPWIKLYRDILDDLEWHELDPNAAKALVGLWIIASESDGILPNAKTLAFRLRMSETSIKSIVSKLSHWLIQGDISVISERYQSDSLERETERETEKEKNTAQARRTQKSAMPENFGISERLKAWALTKGHKNLERHLDHFRMTCKAKGYTYADWDSAFMKAISDNWAKLAPEAERKPDKFDLANQEFRKSADVQITPEERARVAAKFAMLKTMP